MFRTGRLLTRIRRGSFGSTLLLLLGLSAWQYYAEGHISWHYALLDQVQQYTSRVVGSPQAQEPAADPHSIPVGQLLSGRVVDVKDGDTFILRTANQTRYTIRLHGIDTPEWDQPHGKTASTALARLINGREVSVRLEAIDDYGRIVGQVSCDNQDINLAMVRDGHAWWYKQYAKTSLALAAAEAHARETQSGLWSAADPVPPWTWRRRR